MFWFNLSAYFNIWYFISKEFTVILQLHDLKKSMNTVWPNSNKDSYCLDIDECEDNDHCKYGSCVNVEGSFTCNCDSGFTGLHCETGNLMLMLTFYTCSLIVCFFVSIHN